MIRQRRPPPLTNHGRWLSPEGLDSEPCELKSDDIVVEYVPLVPLLHSLSNLASSSGIGIDIVGEDNKTNIHLKFTARVECEFSKQDPQCYMHESLIVSEMGYNGGFVGSLWVV